MEKRTERLLLLLTDFISINLAWLFLFLIRFETGWFQVVLMPELILPMLVVFLYWLALFIFFGMYRTWFALSRFDELLTLFKTSFIGIFLLYFLISLDESDPAFAGQIRYWLFVYWGLLLVFAFSGRLFIRSLQRYLLLKGIGRRKTLIVGFNEKAQMVSDEIADHRALGLDVTGFAAVKDENIGKNYKGMPVLGHIKEIEKIIEEHGIKEVIIAVGRQYDDMLIEIIAKCEDKEVALKIIPDLYEILSGQARTMQLYGFPLISINPQLMTDWEKIAKRLLDIFAAVIILIVTFPIIIITAIAIKIDSKGPALFKQDRCGLNGKIFKMYKFRSMRTDAEEKTGPVWSMKDDPRITKVGKFIRKVRIDEIPQMINVFKGEMSLVGPRPERPFFVEQLSKEIPYYSRRLKVRPGITGWAQVKHKYDETIEDVKTKLQYDLFYIENISLKTDILILIRTIFVVIFGKGHY